MLYQLQEEMLNKDNEKKDKKKYAPVVVLDKKVLPKVTKPNRRTFKVEAIEKEVPVILPFKRWPVKVQKTVYDAMEELPALPVYMLTGFSVTTTKTALVIDLSVERRKRKRKFAALLLMAA